MSAPLVVMIDTPPPTVPMLDLDPATDSAPTGDGITTFDIVTIDGQTAAVMSMRLLDTGATTTSDANGDFTFSGVTLAFGGNSFTVRATDPAGNSSEGTRRFTRLLPGAILLQEGNNFVVQTTAPVDLGQAAGTRTISFDVLTDFDTTDQTAAIEDTLLVYLVDPSDPSQTLLDRGTPGTTLLLLAGEQVEFPPGLVRFDGTTASIDVTSLGGLTQGQLKFQLVGSDGDTGSLVQIANIQSVVDPAGVAGPEFPVDQTLASVGAALDLSTFTAAADAEVIVSNVRVGSPYTAEISLENNGSALGRNVAVVFPGLPAGVTLPNASGVDANGSPYVNVRSGVPAGGLGMIQPVSYIELPRPHSECRGIGQNQSLWKDRFQFLSCLVTDDIQNPKAPGRPSQRLLRLETLEGRLVPDAALGAFAHFADLAVAPQEPASVAVHVRASDFTMPRGRVVLGFAVHATDGGDLDPGSAAVVSLREKTVQPVLRKANVTGPGAPGSSLTLIPVSVGDFSVRWRGEHDTTGTTELDVFLAGDANADYHVDCRDLELIRSRSGTRLGESGFLGEADVNRDGAVNRDDVRLARLNLGAATTLHTPIVTASLAPDSDPDGNGVVLRPAVTIVGQTQPGSMVGWAKSSRSTTVNVAGMVGREDLAHPTATVVSDANGRFQFAVDLSPGVHTIRVSATNSFGQSVAVERTVRYGDVILDWNASMLNVIRDWTTLSNDPYPNRIVPERPPVAARNLAMVHAAMFDAVNVIERTHEPYRVDLVAPEGASPVAAAAAAAHRVASNLYRDPDELAVFDAALAEVLGTVPDGPSETLGVELGRQVGDSILAWRANDGARAIVRYTPGTEPGVWNRTFPDFLPPLLPQWPNVTPFAMTRGDQFRPASPPALDSAEYAAAVNQVKEIGQLGSTTRTAEQTEIALFWADGRGTFTPPGHWNQIAADVALERGTTLTENARLFALLNIAMADAGIVSWDAKYAYNFWRPIDAVRRADMDGNAATAPDPTWTPLLKTPPFPTYTSGHSTQAAPPRLC